MRYEKDWKRRLHNQFLDALYTITNDWGWTWIDLVINLLCYTEVYTKLIKDRKFKEELDVCNVCAVNDGKIAKSNAALNIPEHTFYCEDCPYKTTSKIAAFFYGDQMDGFCYYLNNGDWTLSNPTDLLWDGCKCCGINEDIAEEDLIVEEVPEHVVQFMEEYKAKHPEKFEDEEIEDMGLQALQDHVEEMSTEAVEDSLLSE